MLTFRNNLFYTLFKVQESPPSQLLKMVPIDCPETSARNYHYSLRNTLDERGCHLNRGGGLKSRMLTEIRAFHVAAPPADSLQACISVESSRRFHKIAKSDYEIRHICPSVCMEQLGFALDGNS